MKSGHLLCPENQQWHWFRLLFQDFAAPFNIIYIVGIDLTLRWRQIIDSHFAYKHDEKS